MIIGAQKSGTSSLHNYLATHPAFITHQALEFTYFVQEEAYAQPYARIFAEYFPHYREGQYVIAKSVGVVYEEKALKRLHQHHPEVQLIITLRHPVDRAYSAYWYARRIGWEQRSSFEQSLEDPGDNTHWIAQRFCDYLYRSEYITHLHRVYSYFDKQQVYIMLADELQADATTACNQALQYFGHTPQVQLSEDKAYNRAAMPRHFGVARLLTDRNPLKPYLKRLIPVTLGRRLKAALRTLNEKPFSPPPLAPTTRQQLIEHFKPYNEQLAQLLNKDLSHWNH